MRKNKQREIQEKWMDSTRDMEEFRRWSVRKQLAAIAAFAKATYRTPRHSNAKKG